MQNALLFSFTFFFKFFISPCQNFFLFWLYPSTMKAYHIDHFFFSFFISNYILILSTTASDCCWNFVCQRWNMMKGIFFFWKKKNKTTICCLNSLCRALLALPLYCEYQGLWKIIFITRFWLKNGVINSFLDTTS